jgi:uncharacterized protein (TIGR02722 family)
MKRAVNLMLFFGLMVLVGCSSTKVTRVEIDEKIDLSGQWNDYDAMLAAEELVADCLKHVWQNNFVLTQGRNPAVIVGNVKNRSFEHIDTMVVTKYLEKELLDSGKVVFVASPSEREGIRDEREDQQRGYTDPATVAAVGKERGADYMLIGTFNAIKDELKNKSAVYYQVNLELIDLATNEKIWIGQKEIKKKIQKSKFGI